jgi:hypothetical protein
MEGEEHGSRRVRLLVALLTVVELTAAGAATYATAAALPVACKLLTRTEAKAVTGVSMQPAIRGRTSCTYNGYPTGPAAQVSIFVSPTVPRTLLVDRQLGHKFSTVPRLGDQALEEQWNIFVRKGSVWIAIALVRIDEWSLYRKRLEKAASIAISRVKHSRATAVARPAAAHETLARALGASGIERDATGVAHYTGVIYQPDVVRIGGGVRAIRGVSRDGRTWVVDAHAPGAADLRVGQIMLGTVRASGRIVALRRGAASVEVTLAPVGLTDVVRDGTFEWKGAFASMLRPSARRTSAAGGLTTTPFCCSRGVGVHIGYNRGDGRLAATAQLDWDQGEVWFKIKIDHGRLVDEGFELRSVPALEFEIFGATLDSAGDFNSSPQIVRPMTFQLAGPVAVTFTQTVKVSMQLAGRATLKGHARYFLSDDRGLAANLGFGFPSPQVIPQVEMSTDVPLTENTLALGVGQNAFKLAWRIRATAGVGVGSFAANAWYELKTGLALNADGSLDSLKPGCVTVALSVDDRFGYGARPSSLVRDYYKKIFVRTSGPRSKAVPEAGGASYGPYTVWHPPRAEHCAPTK